MNPYQHFTESRAELRQLKAQLGRMYNEHVAARAECNRTQSAVTSARERLIESERKHVASAERLQEIETERSLLLEKIAESETRFAAVRRWYLREKEKGKVKQSEQPPAQPSEGEDDDAAQLRRAQAAQKRFSSPDNLFT